VAGERRVHGPLTQFWWLSVRGRESARDSLQVPTIFCSWSWQANSWACVCSEAVWGRRIGLGARRSWEGAVWCGVHGRCQGDRLAPETHGAAANFSWTDFASQSRVLQFATRLAHWRPLFHQYCGQLPWVCALCFSSWDGGVNWLPCQPQPHSARTTLLCYAALGSEVLNCGGCGTWLPHCFLALPLDRGRLRVHY